MSLSVRAVILIVAGAALLWPAAAPAAPSGWHVDAPSAAWMVSDGDRWAAWGTAPDTVVALDTVANRRITWTLDRPCRPPRTDRDRIASGGRLLLDCANPDGTSRQATMTLSTGRVRLLPEAMHHPFELPGIVWTDIGRRWASGVVDCVNGPCGMWYDLATHHLVTGILQPERDLDRPKLPRLARCRSTMALMPLPGTAVAGTALLAVRHAPGTGTWRLERVSCSGGTVRLGVERRTPHSLWLGGGLASWTTALPRATSGIRAAQAQRATLTVASGTGAAHVSWRLPPLPVAACDDQLAPGAWGRTAHTRTRAFFAQTLRQEREGRCTVVAVRVLSRALPAAVRAPWPRSGG
jgi:hypothetical protein